MDRTADITWKFLLLSSPLSHPLLAMLIFLFQGPLWGQVFLTLLHALREQVAHRASFSDLGSHKGDPHLPSACLRPLGASSEAAPPPCRACVRSGAGAKRVSRVWRKQLLLPSTGQLNGIFLLLPPQQHVTQPTSPFSGKAGIKGSILSGSLGSP